MAKKKKKTRKVRTVANARLRRKVQKKSNAAKTPNGPLPKSVVSKNRAEGMRLYKLAGCPTQAQCILVYGERGPRMTWEQRAKAGVPAKKFQAALAGKVST